MINCTECNNDVLWSNLSHGRSWDPQLVNDGVTFEGVRSEDQLIPTDLQPKVMMTEPGDLVDGIMIAIMIAIIDAMITSIMIAMIITAIIKHAHTVKFSPTASRNDQMQVGVEAALVVVLVSRNQQIHPTPLGYRQDTVAHVEGPPTLPTRTPSDRVPVVDEGRDVGEEDAKGGALRGGRGQFGL